MKVSLLVVLASSLLSACATPYQKSGLGGGYSETRLAENVFQVSFRANASKRSEGRAEDFALLRCAELTIENGFTYFSIADSKTVMSTSSFTTPMSSVTTGNAFSSGNAMYGSAVTQTYGGQTMFVSRPTASNTIYMFKEKPDLQGMVFDARYIFQSIRKKYPSEFNEEK